MTTTHDIHRIPERGDGRSRHALATSPSGIAVRPAQGANLAYGQLLRERVAGLEPLTPAPKTIRLKKIARTLEGGEYAVIDSPRPIAAVPTHVASRTGRYSKPKLSGGGLLDDLFRGGTSWADCHDNDIYEAARTHADADRAHGNDLRTLNELIQLAVLARAGCPTIPAWELPL